MKFTLLFILTVALGLISGSAFAGEILILENGKTMRAVSYVIDNEMIRVAVNDKSEIAIPLNWIREIRHVADPEPAVPVQQADLDDLLLNSDFAYADLVFSLAKKHDVDWRLVAAVMRAESNFNPRAVSPKGALGLMQLMPATARLYSVTDPYDPVQNIDAGVRHLKMLLQRFPGKLDLVLAAYNSGEKTVDRFKGIPPFSETRSYVKKVLHWMNGLSS
ncbi:MAG TPA: lytic transglycosylase domain-containing protein [Acidobacteriota bacterium]|nr:lytic transglycosylase domain-containing protein [Acidobacteriota bacterium]